MATLPIVDARAPGITLSSPARRIAQTLPRGLSVVLGSDEAGTATLTMTVDRATARKLRLDRRARGPVVVGMLSSAVTSGSRTVPINFTAKARRALRSVRLVKVLVTAVVTDAAGNRSTRTLRVTLRR